MDKRDILDLAWIIPALPAFGAVLLLLFGKRIGEPMAGWIATGLMALAFVGSSQLAPEVEAARANDHDAPLLRGDELGVPEGPEVGRLLTLVEEERAVGTISTRQEAFELVHREMRR